MLEEKGHGPFFPEISTIGSQKKPKNSNLSPNFINSPFTNSIINKLSSLYYVTERSVAAMQPIGTKKKIILFFIIK